MKIHVVTIEPKDLKDYNVTLIGIDRFTHRYHWRVIFGVAILKLAGFMAGFSVDRDGKPCE